MPINTQLRESFSAMIEDFDDLESLEDFVEQLDEEYAEALSEEIADRREVLSGGTLSLEDATPAEMADYLSDHPEEWEVLRDALDQDTAEDAEEDYSDQEDASSAEEASSSAEEETPEAQEDASGDRSDWAVIGGQKPELAEDSSEFDPSAITEEVISWADGPSEAERAFLLRDENEDPSEASAWLGAYARVEDDKLVASRQAVDTMLDRLVEADVDITDEIASAVSDLRDHYGRRADSGESKEDEPKAFAETEWSADDDYDPSSAQAEILSMADGPEQASQYFLTGEAGDPSSLNVPIAKVEDGEIRLSATAIDTAKARIEDADLTDSQSQQALRRLRALQTAVGQETSGSATDNSQARQALVDAADRLGLDVDEDAEFDALAAAVRDATNDLSEAAADDVSQTDDGSPSSSELFYRLANL